MDMCRENSVPLNWSKAGELLKNKCLVMSLQGKVDA